MSEYATGAWHRLDVALDVGEVTAVVVADRAVCVSRTDRPSLVEVSTAGRWV